MGEGLRLIAAGENLKLQQWRGHLDQLLPSRTKVAKVEHHAALPYDALPDFMRDLRERDGVAALALEFTILTAARTSETLNAAWDEFDCDNAIWIVTAERMKGGRGVSSGALVRARHRHHQGDGDSQARRLRVPRSEARQANVEHGDDAGVAPDGTRRPHRAWLPLDLPHMELSERTNYLREVVEAALAHRHRQ